MISKLNRFRQNNLALALVFAFFAFSAVKPTTLEGDEIAATAPTSSPLKSEIDQSEPLTHPSAEEDVQFDRERDENSTRARLISTAIVGGSVLSLLVVLFGYFRLNHATRGYYSRRLQMGAASLAILIALACYFLIVAFN